MSISSLSWGRSARVAGTSTKARALSQIEAIPGVGMFTYFVLLQLCYKAVTSEMAATLANLSATNELVIQLVAGTSPLPLTTYTHTVGNLLRAFPIFCCCCSAKCENNVGNFQLCLHAAAACFVWQSHFLHSFQRYHGWSPDVMTSNHPDVELVSASICFKFPVNTHLFHASA